MYIHIFNAITMLGDPYLKSLSAELLVAVSSASWRYRKTGAHASIVVRCSAYLPWASRALNVF